eukprot:CAMPEP_0201485598 /NCGR_PEP_ID=MMETSP0151_2-20130828/9694_1 /ASSEMBLY_ACC=CAM_ASM_000257 /TAXON_ID=200890 /ORGANISM="Paramoeba atlantica, Strain 621/1 / CCAP 1560/9" /LENGTH=200 /DNA_ID=CAMNT_0047869803 /DNA_START=168 /DNA_END=766 /DNA_ORIENTATION=+
MVLKCAAYVEAGRPIFLSNLLPLRSQLRSCWERKVLTPKLLSPLHLSYKVELNNWEEKFKSVSGCFVVNGKCSSFADAFYVDGEFALLFQYKQRELAKESSIASRRVSVLSIDTVRYEHRLCDISLDHLFVLITDEEFTDFDQLCDNEIVIPACHHELVMGDLLSLLRKYNHHHSKQGKTEIAKLELCNAPTPTPTPTPT